MARVDMDEAGIEFLLRDPAGPVQRDLDHRAVRVLAAQVAACPVDTGRLRASLEIDDRPTADGSPARQIGSGVDYVLNVELGTGLYGPMRRKITPKKPGKELVWEDAEGKHFARSVKGQRAQPFIRPSLRAAKD